MDFGGWKARCVSDVEMVVLEWPRSILQGAQKGLEAREVDEQLCFRRAILPYRTFAGPTTGCTT